MNYKEKLHHINKYISNPDLTTQAEGYDLLFRLWRQHFDNIDFPKDVGLTIQLNENFSNEMEIRLKNILSNNIDDTQNFIQKYFDEFMEEIIRQQKNKKKLNENNKNLKKIFISYAHEDEKFKDELVNILAPLEDHGVITIWQDREIKPGKEWYQEIQLAMNTCDIALLLISGDFLSSRFIKRIEIPNLLRRRSEEGLYIVPIIIRSCLWRTIPVLRDLQALPKDGKPVAGFDGKDERDRIWTEIAIAIKDLC